MKKKTKMDQLELKLARQKEAIEKSKKEAEEYKKSLQREKIDYRKKHANLISLSVNGVKERFKLWYLKRKNPDRMIVVNMELINGDHATFVAKESEGAVEYLGKRYILDSDLKYYNINAKVWMYDFHEAFSMPIKRIIPVNDIRSTIENMKNVEVEYATNPLTLERFITAKIAEGIMKGQELDEIIRQARVLLFVMLAITTTFFLLWMYKAGMFSQVTGVI